MNISRNVKRLLLIIALSVIVILVSKSLLTKAVNNLSIEAEKKLLAKAGKLPVRLPESAPAISSSLDISRSAVVAGNMSATSESSPVAVEDSPVSR
jgi:hypothetical protein